MEIIRMRWLLLCIVAEMRDIDSQIFFRRLGKKLVATPIRKITGITSEKCLGACMFEDKCKSFNAYQNTTAMKPVCDLFEQDRCNSLLVDDQKTSYFDMVADFQCV